MTKNLLYLIKQYEALDGQTPAEKVGIEIKGKINL